MAARGRVFSIAQREEVPDALRTQLDGPAAHSYFCGEFNLLSNVYVILDRLERQGTE